ncbi:MAG: carboxy terminal-processing peptidase, partial [Halioglobus sp.]
EIGESSLDHALNWDQINPVRHRMYNDLSSVLPVVNAQFAERSSTNPDFIYLEDQAALAQQTRDMSALPLNESARLALRDSQEQKALAIENKRRKAKGEPLLSELDEEESDEDEIAGALGGEQDETDVADDVLLLEAGNVLVDMLMLKENRVAMSDRRER